MLGTVLGTAIQGQIVGKAVAPCIENPPFLSENNFSAAIRNVNMTHYSGSLADTVN